VAAPLTGTGIPHTILQTTITLPSVSGMVDDVLLLPIAADQDLGSSAVHGWSGSISFNPTMLYPLAVNTAGTMSAGMAVKMTYDQQTGVLHLDALDAGGGTLAGGLNPLAIIAFRVLVGDDVTTPLRLSADFSFLDGYATVTRRVDGDFTLLGYCRAGERLIRPVAGTLLRQSHPNPVPGDAAGVTTIDFRMAQDGHALLTLHDMMGRELRTLINGPLSAGEHSYRLSTQGLPAGVYSYTLVTDGFRATRQLVISR
jgi:hypothetical protein